MIKPVILCGGSGTRLWPASKPEKPKPFLPLMGTRTLFQQALERVSDRADFAPPLVVAGAAHVPWIVDQGGGVELIVEPCARNTAPAIALAASMLPTETVMLVCPSDHYIADEAAFRKGALQAAKLAEDGWLVSFGIQPDRAETGYGYIERGEPLAGGHRVKRFVEKPDAVRAAEFLSTGQFVWNGGIFAFRAGRLLEELSRYRTEMAELVGKAVKEGRSRGGAFLPAAEIFSTISSESIDYAVMENTDRAAVVAANMGWSDIGSWQALMDARGDDQAPQNAEFIDCDRVMVRTDGPRVSVVGISDAIIVVEGNEVLVVSRDAAQKVSRLAGAQGE